MSLSKSRIAIEDKTDIQLFCTPVSPDKFAKNIRNSDIVVESVVLDTQ